MADEEAHPGLSVLVLGDEHPVPEGVQTLDGRHFLTDTNRIFALLAERPGFPKVQ